MGYIVKLIYGSFEFNLNDANFTLGEGFGLPAAEYALNKGIGTAANETGGVVVGKRAVDRAWSFGVRIMGGSAAATHNAANRLRAFLDLAYHRRDTLYFAFKPSDAYEYEPIWGQYGAYYRIEIMSALLSIDSGLYGSAGIRERGLMGTVECVIGPYTLGKRQMVASAIGGVLEDTLGTAVAALRELRRRMDGPVEAHRMRTDLAASIEKVLADVPEKRLEPGTAALHKLCRLGNFCKSQDIHIECTRLGFLPCWHSNLNVVDGKDGHDLISEAECPSALRLHWLPGIDPGLKPTKEGGNFLITVLQQEERRTGARVFVRSGTVGDDPLLLVQSHAGRV